MIKNLPAINLGKGFATAMLKTQKHSPAILFSVGVVGVVGTVVTASRATLKLSDIVDETSTTLEQIKTHVHDDYSDQDRTKDKAILYTKTVIDISKLYAPSIALGIFSIGCLAGSHNILSRRNVALSAAYAGVDKAFKEYRGRVIDEIGDEREAKIFRPVEEVDAIDEKGKTVKVNVHNGVGGSPYKALFDQTNTNWSKTPEYNQLFIQGMQNYANDLLRARGHIFLNDVHDMLGLERTKAGQIVGWVSNGAGDNYVDFGVFTELNAGMQFVRGEERSIWLDFNVDGNVLDLM